ncbi:hypothetical protein HHI36_024261 [Cryptolaemus montrouzieri]|uniref:Uncharacterized protein n=1 Tax=Cryptolaemus montrouzieri TaxID=559131 RepID=A0ABD2NPJ9_9CUCU
MQQEEIIDSKKLYASYDTKEILNSMINQLKILIAIKETDGYSKNISKRMINGRMHILKNMLSKMKTLVPNQEDESTSKLYVSKLNILHEEEEMDSLKLYVSPLREEKGEKEDSDNTQEPYRSVDRKVFNSLSSLWSGRTMKTEMDEMTKHVSNSDPMNEISLLTRRMKSEREEELQKGNFNQNDAKRQNIPYQGQQLKYLRNKVTSGYENMHSSTKANNQNTSNRRRRRRNRRLQRKPRKMKNKESSNNVKSEVELDKINKLIPDDVMFAYILRHIHSRINNSSDSKKELMFNSA